METVDVEHDIKQIPKHWNIERLSYRIRFRIMRYFDKYLEMHLNKGKSIGG